MTRALLILILAVVVLAPTASAVRAAAPPGPAAGQAPTRALPPGWGKMYDWNDTAAKFAVAR